MTVLAIQTIYQGDTANLDFIVQDYDGSVQNLTDCEVRWALSDPADLSTALIEKEDGDGISVIDAANGRLTVTLTAGDTSELSGTYRHELEITLPSGATYTFAQGPLIIKPTVYPTA
jgi:hypothetical protein